VRRVTVAIASGLALADAAVVILALPPILLELHTSVEGVAAVIGVYTAVLTVTLPISAALHGRATGAAGSLLFAAASVGCASSNSLELLLVMRALQALGASALLAAAFDALDGGGEGRRLWIGAAVAGTAAGPALGGVLTELFDWRAIFIAQAPLALVAAPGLLQSHIPTVHEALPRPPRDLLASLALALLSGAITAVVFLLVLLLISGWSIDPLAAAAAVTVLPVAAVAGSFVPAPAATRAVAGCLLVAGGIACLALLPEPSAFWTLAPQLLAGLGMGMAFPAVAGELLPERTRAQSAALLSLRHAGITLALVALAPLVAAKLDDQVQLARERGTAVVLVPRRRGIAVGSVGAALAVAVVLPLGYGIAERNLGPEPVQIADPCQPRDRRSAGGLEGLAEDVVLKALDRAACRFGSSREELVLALFDDKTRREYEKEHGVDPRQLENLLKAAIGL
jgi:Major Facilitator Superfamily